MFVVVKKSCGRRIIIVAMSADYFYSYCRLFFHFVVIIKMDNTPIITLKMLLNLILQEHSFHTNSAIDLIIIIRAITGRHDRLVVQILVKLVIVCLKSEKGDYKIIYKENSGQEYFIFLFWSVGFVLVK